MDDVSFRNTSDDEITFSNKPSDAISVYADNVIAIALDKNVVKIGFVEVLPNVEGGSDTRFALNLTISRSGLPDIIDALQDALRRTEDHEAQTSR